MSQREEQLDAIVSEFKQRGTRTCLSWPVVRAARLRRIWLDFGRSGVVRDEKGLDNIAHQILRLIARLYTTTELSGHTPFDLRPEAEELLGTHSDRDWQEFLDYLVTETGGFLVSDFAFTYLQPLYLKLYKADQGAEQLYIIDRILNVVHQRSDLASLFVEGGSETLTQIALQGGYSTPKEQLDQAWLRN